ncbi:MAG TPA: hypothetical protein VLF60_04990 [Candidatus Saccharimonadales bacterium]|nr:hypothetical protein [Candidatus Saccharimonadales bacterium]
MKIAAVIPTLGERPELAELTRQLVAEDVDVLVLGLPGENLHHIWNHGARMARDWRKADVVAILNDDLRLPAGSLAAMANSMLEKGFACVGVDSKAAFGIGKDVHIDEMTGGGERLMEGITTWCFIVRADAWQDIDEQYEWWYGVGDLFEKVQSAGGRLGAVRGIGIEHALSGTARNHPWTEAAKLRDAKRWRESHRARPSS